jgi:hypothetical protein
MNATKQKAIDFAIEFAENNIHGYTQSYPERWGTEGDCSSVEIRSQEAAGIPVRSYGATCTGNMKEAYLKAGFTDVTHLINLATGEGLEPADVLLRIGKHTAKFIGTYAGKANQIVQAQGNEFGGKTGGKPGDQTGREIYIRNYYVLENTPWDVVLRYTKEDEDMNPYIEPTQTYPAGQTFRGNDAKWFIYELIKRGYNLIADSDVAGNNTWSAIYTEQEKAGIQVGDATDLTRMVLKGESGVAVILKLQNENAGLRKRMADALVSIDNAASILE